MTEKNKIEVPQIMNVKNEKVEVFNFILEDFLSSPRIKNFDEAGDLSIIYSNNGKRFALSKEICIKIDNPDYVSIKFFKNGIVFINADDDKNNAYELKSQGGKRIVYCGPLVKEVIDKFDLDFANRSCRTFAGARVVNNGEQKMLVIELV